MAIKHKTRDDETFLGGPISEWIHQRELWDKSWIKVYYPGGCIENDAYDWLATIKGKWAYPTSYEIYFTNEDDAVLFQLMWC